MSLECAEYCGRGECRSVRRSTCLSRPLCGAEEWSRGVHQRCGSPVIGCPRGVRGVSEGCPMGARLAGGGRRGAAQEREADEARLPGQLRLACRPPLLEEAARRLVGLYHEPVHRKKGGLSWGRVEVGVGGQGPRRGLSTTTKTCICTPGCISGLPAGRCTMVASQGCSSDARTSPS